MKWSNLPIDMADVPKSARFITRYGLGTKSDPYMFEILSVYIIKRRDYVRGRLWVVEL